MKRGKQALAWVLSLCLACVLSSCTGNQAPQPKPAGERKPLPP